MVKKENNTKKLISGDEMSPLSNTRIGGQDKGTSLCNVLENQTSPLFNTPISSDTESDKISKVVYLPKPLFDKVEELLSGKRVKKENKQKVLYLAYLILSYQENNGCSFEEFAKPLSVEYYLKKGPPNGSFGERFYKNVFLPLAADLPGSKMAINNRSKNKITFDDAIFQSNGEPNKFEGRAMLYRINPSLLTNDFKAIHIDKVKFIESINKLFTNQIRHFLKTAGKLWIDEDALRANLKYELSVSTVLVRPGVYKAMRNFNEVYQEFNIEKKSEIYEKVTLRGEIVKSARNVPLEYALAIANSDKTKKDLLMVIIDGNTLHVDTIEHFQKMKQNRLQEDLFRKIEKIKTCQFDYTISSSNGRLATNLTNLNNIALKYLRYGGSDGLFLGAFDLKSSQPTILANLIASDVFFESLKSSTHPSIHKYLDVFSKIRNDLQINKEKFLEVVTKKDIYKELAATFSQEGIQNENSLLPPEDLRTAAKAEMMRYLFAGPNFKSEIFSLNKVIAGLEESVKKLKEEFNQKFGTENNHFNLFLQLCESFIFIDKILGRLAKNGIPGFTKHDSVLFPRDYKGYNLERVEMEILQTFIEIGFNGELKYTRHLYIDSSDPRFVGFTPFIECPSLLNSNGEKSLYGKFN